MLPSESRTLVDKLKNLFSRWTPTADEITAWERLFAKLDDYDDAQLALERHWEKCKRLSPVPNDVRNIYNSIRQSKGHEHHKDNCGKTDVWIQCVEAPPQFPGRLGQYHQVMFGQDGQIPRDPCKVLAIADMMRGWHESLYGGCWIVLDGWTRERVENAKTRLIESEGRERPISKYPIPAQVGGAIA